jgi:methionyl-tRNA formyltransferase
MKISVICSDAAHPINSHLEHWAAKHAGKIIVEIVRRKRELRGGDILFLVSCTELITTAELQAYRIVLVLHASDLPDGRGWSPHIWQIIGGAEKIVLTLLEASESVDSGRIWKKTTIPVPRHALWDEINELLFAAEIELMDLAIEQYGLIDPIDQPHGSIGTYYARRTPKDSRLDMEKSISDQFDLMRVCDPNRFPAFFEIHGHRYAIRLEKINES